MNRAGPQLTINAIIKPLDIPSDTKSLGSQDPSRCVRLSRVTPAGGGAIAKSEDGCRCAVTGKECASFCCLWCFVSYLIAALRILRISPPSETQRGDHKSAVGEGGCRIDASRNFWEGSGLKIDSVSTDVAWGYGSMYVSQGISADSDHKPSLQQQDPD